MSNDTHDDKFTPPTKDALSLMTDRLRLLSTRQAEMWWDIGVLLDEVAMYDLAPALGFDDFADYGQSVLDISKAQAGRFRRVAHYFARETALRFGAEKLDLLLTYLEATPSANWAVDVLRVEILVSTKDGEIIPFSEISIEDLQRAVRSAKRRRSTADPSIPQDVAAVRDRLADAVSEKIEQKNVKVKVHHTASGSDEFSLCVTGVDPFNMEEVGKVLVAEGKVLARMWNAGEE